MKKLLLIAILSLSMSSYSQETFVRKFTMYVTKIDNVLSKTELSDVVFVFNDKKTTDITINGTGDQIRLYKIGDITEGETKSGIKYQVINCINSENGKEVDIQLFENVVRLFLPDSDDYIEYH